MDGELISDEEIDNLLNDVFERYGYDFTSYSKASVKRRVVRLVQLDKFSDFSLFRKRVIGDEAYITRFVQELTVNVTEMFRDPLFYRVLREKVLPILATHPFIRIWHAGCSSGEEVYSMAILLSEFNLMHKSLLYATDINPAILQKVTKGIYPISAMKQYSENYINSGGTKDFSTYYHAKYDLAKFDDSLKKKIIVSTHNLVSDSSFNEFQLIFCRNVLIYFDKQLQDRVLNLFDSSLEKLGFLALGSKESIKFSHLQNKYEQDESNQKIWRKIM